MGRIKGSPPPPSAWKKGCPSPNPKGRPKEGQSWTYIIREMSEKPPEEVAEMVGGKSTELGRQFLQMPKGVPMKYIVVARMMSDLMFQPSKGIWDSLVDRDEGKVPDKLESKNEVRIDGFEEILKKVYGHA